MKEQLQEAFLDRFNNFLTDEKFAENYGLTLEQAKQLIALWRSVHESIVAFHKELNKIPMPKR